MGSGTLYDLAVPASLNIATAIAFLLAFAVLRIQPINDRVYFTKWYLNAGRQSPRVHGTGFRRYVNLDPSTYLSFLSWVPGVFSMTEAGLIEHAGLDSAIFLRVYILGLKLFVPITVLALLVLIPVNLSGGTLLNLERKLLYSDIDKLSISNIRDGSQRFWIHIQMTYFFTFWTCYQLYKEYKTVALMRRDFLASARRRADEFTVVVRNIPKVPGHSPSEVVDLFFRRNHPDHYLGHQAVYDANNFAMLVQQKEKLKDWLDYNQLKFQRNPGKRPTIKNGFLGLLGEKVDAIDYFREKIRELDMKINYERGRVLTDPDAMMPVAFVTFDTRWGAAVCAQTQQSKNPTRWLTDWAPEPRDVYWENLPIPFVSQSIRKRLIPLAVFVLIFFYMIPIAFVQSLANLEGLGKVAPFLRELVNIKMVKGFCQGFLPGLVLKLFLRFLPTILLYMSKVEGYISFSFLERKAAAKYYYFMLVNVFLGSIVTGTAFQQLYFFIHQPPNLIPVTIGVSIPMKATFFMTYIMVDGLVAAANEVVQPKALILYHLKVMFLAKTDKDRENAMEPRSIGLHENLPPLELYFLLGLVYAVVSPILLPFILIYFAFGFLVYRHQIINVYNQEYESAGAFWPQVHGRIIASLVMSHVILCGLLSTKKASYATPMLLVLLVLTIWFHKYCKKRFEPTFQSYSIEEAIDKDMLEEDPDPDFDLKKYLANAYLHPIFRSFEEEDDDDDDASVDLTTNKRQQQQPYASFPAIEPPPPPPPRPRPRPQPQPQPQVQPHNVSHYDTASWNYFASPGNPN